MRGFVITGDESYLEPYKSALIAIPRLLVELRGSPPTIPISSDGWRSWRR